MARAQKRARIAVCTYDGPLEVRGRVRSFGPLTRGAEVDLDAIVDHDGAGVPVTLGEALGPHVEHFEIIGAPRAAEAAPARGHEEGEV